MRPALLVALLAAPAFAQVNTLYQTDQSRGLTLLPESAAYADRAGAMSYNPAGLAHVSGPELFYAHERSVARDQLGDGLYAAVAPLDLFGVALSHEWLRLPGNRSWGKTSLGLAFGGEAISVGAAYNWFRGNSIASLESLDLGVQTRPFRAVSLGASLRNVDAPAKGSTVFPRVLDVGLGVRPFGERLTLSLDWQVDDVGGASGSRLGWAAKGEVLKGLQLFAGVSHGFQSSGPGSGVFFQAGIELDTNSLSGGYAFGYTPSGLDHLIFARITADNQRPLPLANDPIAVIDLDGIGETSTSSSLAGLIGLSEQDKYLRLLKTLYLAADDPRLKGVVLKIEPTGISIGRALELREAILALKAKGKRVDALVLNAGDVDYLIASAADGVWAVPEAMLAVDGLQSSVLYLGGAAEKLHVEVDVARVGAYKNSPDQYTRQDMSKEQKEAIDAYLDAFVRNVDQRVTQSRKLSSEQWQASIDSGLKSPRVALEQKLIDEIVTPEELELKLRKLLPGARLSRGYKPNDELTGRWGSKRKIAVVPVLGAILGGKDRADPLGQARIAGAESFIKALDSAVRDADVAAIVLRVDSPGGDGLASDLMYRAVLEAKKHKPVVASMGDVAASGGYYVAMGADEIWALPTTITGSIGVYYIKPSLKGLAEQLGANQVSVARGKLSGELDFYQPWDDARRAAMQKWIDDFYDGFITEAAKSRKKTKPEIDQVARGRVWAGEDALAKGLVDQLGGLKEAVESAKKKAGASPDDEMEISIVTGGGGALGGLLESSGAAQKLREVPVNTGVYLPPPVSDLAARLQRLGIEAGGVQTRLEYDIKVE